MGHDDLEALEVVAVETGVSGDQALALQQGMGAQRYAAAVTKGEEREDIGVFERWFGAAMGTSQLNFLNADDLHCLRMADHTKAARIAYVTMNPKHDLVRQHIRAGGAAAVLEEGINGAMITLYDRGSHIPLLWAHLIPATLEGKALFNVQNSMFAALMAFVMGCKVDNIRQGLRTFDTTFFQAPGRLNVYDDHPFKVILDYGHNPAAVAAMADLASRLKVTGRRICVLAGPGDRRDEDIRDMARTAGIQPAP